MAYIIFVSISIPLIMLLFMTYGQSRYVIGFTILGIAMALISYDVNSIIRYIYKVNDFDLRILVSPITEEIIKAIPPLFFTIFISKNRKKIVSIAMAVGIGFAVFENVYMLVLGYKYVDIWWALMRGFSTGLMHGMTTAIVGYGMSFINKKKLFFTGIFGLLCVSFTYHGIYNLLVESRYKFIGIIIPVITYLAILLSMKKINMSQSNFNILKCVKK